MKYDVQNGNEKNVYHVHELAFVSLATSNKSLYKLRFLSQ